MKIMSIKFVEASSEAIIYAVTYKKLKWFKKVEETKNIVLDRRKDGSLSSFADLYESGDHIGNINMSMHVANICKHDFQLNHPYK